MSTPDQQIWCHATRHLAQNSEYGFSPRMYSKIVDPSSRQPEGKGWSHFFPKLFPSVFRNLERMDSFVKGGDLVENRTSLSFRTGECNQCGYDIFSRQKSKCALQSFLFFILMNINQFSFRCLYENLLDFYMVSGAHVQKNVEAVNSIETWHAYRLFLRTSRTCYLTRNARTYRSQRQYNNAII